MEDVNLRAGADTKVQLRKLDYDTSLRQHIVGNIRVFRDSLGTALSCRKYEDCAFYVYAPLDFVIDKKEALDYRYYNYSIGLSSAEPAYRLAFFLSQRLQCVSDALVLIATTDHEGDYFLRSYEMPFVLIDRPKSAETAGPRPAYLMFNQSNGDVRSIKRALREGAVCPSLVILTVSTGVGSTIHGGSVITESEAQFLAANTRQIVMDIFDYESRLICDFEGEVERL